MSRRIPRWVRVVLAVDRVGALASRVQQTLRDEVLYAWTDADERAHTTAGLYDSQLQYAEGGDRFSAGLFEWERRAIATPPFPSRGTILLGGAGGGREVAGLAALGYRVIAFEPST